MFCASGLAIVSLLSLFFWSIANEPPPPVHAPTLRPSHTHARSPSNVKLDRNHVEYLNTDQYLSISSELSQHLFSWKSTEALSKAWMIPWLMTWNLRLSPHLSKYLNTLCYHGIWLACDDEGVKLCRKPSTYLETTKFIKVEVSNQLNNYI